MVYHWKMGVKKLKKDRRIVLEAVKQNGLALQYADESLKRDKEVVIEAVKQNGSALKYVDQYVRGDYQFMIDLYCLKTL